MSPTVNDVSVDTGPDTRMLIDDRLVWRAPLVLPVDEDGRTQTVKLDGVGGGTLVLRVVSDDGGPLAELCPILDDVHTSDGATWVAPLPATGSTGFFCTDCTQRVHLGYGSGVFVFPNDGEPLDASLSVSLRVSLRSCLTRLEVSATFDEVPARIRLDVAWRPPLPPDLPATVRLRLGVATVDAFDPALPGSAAFLSSALATARALFAPAGIALDLAGTYRLPPASPPMVEFGPADLSALATPLSALLASGTPAEPDSEVPVLLVPCLAFRDAWTQADTRPAGHVPRIPGGFAAGGVDGVFLRAEGCGIDSKVAWTDPEQLGRLLAHELGHYLGLYHVTDGDIADVIADTSPMSPNLMHAVIGAEGGFSPAQVAVMRAHPMVRLTR